MRVKPEIIKIALIQRQLTQKELAEHCGISRQTINGICCGRSCRSETIEKVADALGVPVEKLIKKGR